MHRSLSRKQTSLLLGSCAALLTGAAGCNAPDAPTAAPETSHAKLSTAAAVATTSSARAAFDAARARVRQEGIAAPGEILLKFKDSEAVGTVADTLLTRGQSFATIMGRSSLDERNRRYGVRSMQRLSARVAAVPTGALSPSSAQSLHQQQTQAATGAGNLYRIRFTGGEDVAAVAADYAKDPAVAYAVPNYQRPTSYRPNDPLYPQQWAHQATAIESAWDTTRGNAGVVVAVIDSGVAYTHPDLNSKIWYSSAGTPGYDFVDVDTAGLESRGFVLDPEEDYTLADADPADRFGHGTHCAGIAASATDNSQGMAAVAPNVRIMALRAGYSIGQGNPAAWNALVDDAATIQAIDYAIANGASVISMSFGGLLESAALNEALERAKAAGVVLVAAAGNGNTSTVGFPAAHPGVIAVAATDRNNARASYSTFGARVDVAAPGGDLDASGAMTIDSGIVSTVPFTGPLADPSGYRPLRGTSMATPYVAGVAALLRSQMPTLSAAELRTRLVATGRPVVGTNYDQMGGGLIDVAQALTSPGRPFLAVRKVTFVETSGNGNGILESGETAKVAVELENIWTAAQSATVRIGSSASAIVIGQGTAALGAVAAGATVHNDSLTVTIGDVPQRDSAFHVALTVEVVAADDRAYSWSTRAPVLIGSRAMNAMPSVYATVSGRTAAYLAFDGQDRYDVYTTDLITGVETRITQAVGYDFWQLQLPFSVNIAGNWVLYTDTRKGIADSNVYLYDPARGELVVSDAPDVQWGFGISGTRVVFIDSSSGTDQIFVRDMADTSTPAVLVGSGSEPRISGHRVVFTATSEATGLDVYLHDLDTGTTSAVLADAGDQVAAAISGTRLLFVDADDSLNVLDVVTNSRTQVTAGPVRWNTVSLSGTKVVWTDERTGQQDVYVRDLADASGQEIRLTSSAGAHLEPRISGNRVVWTGQFPTAEAVTFAELGPELGDANYNSSVDIVDALTVANHSSGKPVPRFFSSAADVNCDGTANIVDALLIAQRSAGSIGRFPCQPE